MILRQVKVCIMIITMIAISGCAQLQHNQQPTVHCSLAAKHHFQPTNQKDIAIKQSSQQPYLVIGRVYVKTAQNNDQTSPSEQAQQLMKQQAAKLGGDAVIDLHQTDHHYVGTIIHFVQQ